MCWPVELAWTIAGDMETAVVQMERNNAGLQMIIPGCERRTLPKSSSSANWCGQGLLGFYAEPTLPEKMARLANAPLTAKRGQKALPKSGLFSI
jgi:hypothetical protein